MRTGVAVELMVCKPSSTWVGESERTQRTTQIDQALSGERRTAIAIPADNEPVLASTLMMA